MKLRIFEMTPNSEKFTIRGHARWIFSTLILYKGLLMPGAFYEYLFSSLQALLE